MSATEATEYADSLAKDILANCVSGHPFGTWEESDDEHKAGDELTAYDWLTGVLDVQYLVNSDRTYRAARILVAFGGPNAWIDTRTGQLEVTWWSSPEYRYLPSEFIDQLDAEIEELWAAELEELSS